MTGVNPINDWKSYKVIQEYADKDNQLFKRIDWLVRIVTNHLPPQVTDVILKATAKCISEKKGEDIVLALLISEILGYTAGVTAIIGSPTFFESKSSLSNEKQMELALSVIRYRFDSPQILGNLRIIMNKKQVQHA